MLFVARASAIRGIGSLKEFIKALDNRPKAFRDRYLGAAARVNIA